MKSKDQRAATTLTPATDGERVPGAENRSISAPPADAPASGNGRPLPASLLTPPPPPPPPHLEDYRNIIGQGQVDALRFRRES